MAVSGNTISYKTIIENVYRNFQFKYDLDHNDALEWIGSLINHIGSPYTLENKTECIEILDYRGKLPCDLHTIRQTARQYGEDENPHLVPMRWATNTFHMKYHCDREDFECNSGVTYQVDNNFIYTSFEEGKVALSYLAIPTDDEGYPLIPAEESFIKAFEWEIAARIGQILWMQNELGGDKFQYIDQQRDWYVAQAINKAKMPDVGRMEAITQYLNTSIRNGNQYDNFFANMQLPEQRYNHNSVKSSRY